MSFTERAGLFPVLLLTGCTSPTVVTGPPSGSVVDSYLSRSAADISAMQYRIHQSGPSAQRPISPSVNGGKSSQPPRPLIQGGAVRSPQLPVSVIKDSHFLRDSGAAPTLRSAVRKIVPADRTVVFDKTVMPDAPEFYTWAGNDRWPYVLNKLLAAKGFKATINENARTVTIEPVQSAQAARISTASIAKLTPSGLRPTVTAPSTGRNPFHGDLPATPAKSVPGKAILTSLVGPPAPVVKLWKIEKGSTLRQGFTLWASQERCFSDKAMWEVRWDTDTNYPVDFTLSFRATNFEDATTQLFNLWHNAQVPLFVKGYYKQCLIIVSDGH